MLDKIDTPEEVALIISLFAVVVSILSVLTSYLIYRKSQSQIDKYKHIDSTILIETNKEIFEGYLKSFGITTEQLEKDQLDIKQLMYFCSLLNVRWIAANRFSNFYRKTKKIRRKINKHGYANVLNDAINNSKNYQISDECTLGKAIRTDDFQKAWKYISDIWCDSSSIILMIEYTIQKDKKAGNIVNVMRAKC